MGAFQLECNGSSAVSEGVSNKHSDPAVSLNVSNIVGNLLLNSQGEEKNQVEASPVVKVSEPDEANKVQLLSRVSSVEKREWKQSSCTDDSDGTDSVSDKVLPELDGVNKFQSISRVGSVEKRESKQSLCADCSGDIDSVSDKVVIPRIGEEYQAEVPPLMSDRDQYSSTVPYSYIVGLPMLVTWAHIEERNTKDETSTRVDLEEAKGSAGSQNSKKSLLVHSKKDSELKTKPPHVHLNWRKDSKLAEHGPKAEGIAQWTKLNVSKRQWLVPDYRYESWKVAEENNFLLGLYIFGKNFVQIKRFIENKDIGDIQSFYYGKFCGSKQHQRWSNCIRRGSNKRVWGKKIFMGWRQQELQSRLLRNATEENQNKLLEVSKLFAAEEISLEEYVFSLKAIFGLQNLAKAVAVGKVKEDLTGLGMAPICPRIPTGKACSSLKPCDIIKCLTGHFRLSKDQLGDIFWEAVWPRLLAKGWHSEQPRNRRNADSKKFLVFLKPGVDTFSRQMLVKGKDYFDSFKDVLCQVASEPQLLNSEAEEARGDALEQIVNCPPVNSSEESLEPENYICNMSFTIVDTSSLDEGKPFKLRKLSDIADKFEATPQSPCHMEESTRNFIGNLKDQYGEDTSNKHLTGEKIIHRAKQCTGVSDRKVSTSMQCTVVDTSLAHGERMLGLKGIKRLRDWNFEKTSPKTKIAKPSKNLQNLQWQENSGVPRDGDMLAEYGNSSPSDHGILRQKKWSLDVYNADPSMGNQLDPCAISPDDKPLKKTIKLCFSRRAKGEHSKSVTRVVEPCSSTAFAKEDTVQNVENVSEGSGLKKLEPCCKLNSLDACLNQEKEPTPSFFPEGSTNGDRDQSTLQDNCSGMNKDNWSGMNMSVIKSKSTLASEDNRSLEMGEDGKEKIVADGSAVESEKVGFQKMEEGDKRKIRPDGSGNQSVTKKLTSSPGEQRTAIMDDAKEDQSNVMSKRKSKRNRPLTTKALEALESGFFNVKRRKRSADVENREKILPNNSFRASNGIEGTSNCGDSTTFPENAADETMSDTP